MSRFLSICPVLGVSKSVETAAGMGIAVTFVMTLASAVTYIAYYYLLIPLNISFLYNIAFILIIAALVQLVEMFIKKSSPSLYRALGVYLPLITTNCAVLGVAVINLDEGYNLIISVVNGASAAIGFTLAIVLLAGIREKIDKNDILPHFKGFPLSLLSAGLMSLAFLGFKNLIK
jgi:electron transport complex protein RnfA